MTNNIGTLKVYKEDDINKAKYIKEINIGDLVFFHKESLKDTTPQPTNNYPGEVGIYIGNNEFIHSSKEKEKITIDKIENNYLKTLVGTRDILTGIFNKK